MQRVVIAKEVVDLQQREHMVWEMEALVDIVMVPTHLEREVALELLL
tara:strand:+ start:259 stop:399 length:141 start_codon:yes stop_codon:yes gene_type:complete